MRLEVVIEVVVELGTTVGRLEVELGSDGFESEGGGGEGEDVDADSEDECGVGSLHGSITSASAIACVVFASVPIVSAIVAAHSPSCRWKLY